MNAAFDAVFVVVFMVVAVWVFGFGVGCALLAHGSRWGRPAAFSIGALFGPVGLVIVGYSRRTERSAPNSAWPEADALDPEPVTAVWPQFDGPTVGPSPMRPPD